MYETFSKSTLNEISISRNTISGKIKADSEGTMYISLPNYDALKVYVDGMEVNKFDYLSGIGISVEPGQHEISIAYVDESRSLYLLLTLGFIILLIVFYIINSKLIAKKLKTP